LASRPVSQGLTRSSILGSNLLPWELTPISRKPQDLSSSSHFGDWKSRNDVISNNTRPNHLDLSLSILDEARLWLLAGANELPSTSPCSASGCYLKNWIYFILFSLLFFSCFFVFASFSSLATNAVTFPSSWRSSYLYTKTHI
jgi:hypothetical protein